MLSRTLPWGKAPQEKPTTRNMRGTEMTYTDQRYLTMVAKGEYRSHPSLPWTPYQEEVYSDFEMASQGNPGPPYTTGGPWLLRRKLIRGNAISAATTLCNGQLILGTRTSSRIAGTKPSELTENEVTLHGTSLWGRAVPTAPQANTLASLAEVYREGIPSAVGLPTWRARTALARGAGSEYLNVQFGWKPLVNDIRKFANSVNHYDKIISGYIRNSGQKLHRSRELPTLRSETFFKEDFAVRPSGASVFAKGGGTTETQYQKIWFEGDFKYYVPVGNTTLERLKRYNSSANYLLGTKLTPEVLWNLAPWSWAVDWFGNAGDVMKNISAMGSDGLVSTNSFLMHRSFIEHFATGVVGSKNITGTLNRLTVDEYKARDEASPFGFAVDWDGFNAYQISIAAAIGLTYSPRRFSGSFK